MRLRYIELKPEEFTPEQMEYYIQMSRIRTLYGMLDKKSITKDTSRICTAHSKTGKILEFTPYIMNFYPDIDATIEFAIGIKLIYINVQIFEHNFPIVNLWRPSTDISPKDIEFIIAKKFFPNEHIKPLTNRPIKNVVIGEIMDFIEDYT